MKKAILFTLISVLFSALFISLFSEDYSTSITESIPSTNIRIKVLDTYTRNFDKYTDHAFEIATYKTLESITQYNKIQGRFLPNEQSFNDTFENCITCGLMDCNIPLSPACQDPISGYDLNKSLTNISDLARSELNINTTFKINSVEITQKLPYEVEVTLNLSYNVSDNAGGDYALWERNRVTTQKVSIIGLSDPLFYPSTDGLMNRQIIRYTGSCEFNESCWNVTNVKYMFDRAEYRFSVLGTSYIQRFWNSSTASACCGLESFLNSTMLGNWVRVNNSFVDHYYWAGNYSCQGTPGETPIIIFNNIYTNFSLDEETASRYNIINDGIITCP